jgi:hypothetical protein
MVLIASIVRRLSIGVGAAAFLQVRRQVQNCVAARWRDAGRDAERIRRSARRQRCEVGCLHDRKMRQQALAGLFAIILPACLLV